MSTSPARNEANRLNALKSTGPRTEEGLARSAQNARTHGRTASTLPPPVRANERFQALAAAMREMFAPAGLLEEDLVDRILQARWNLFTAERLITGFVDLAEDLDWDDPEADPERARTRRLATVLINDAHTNAFSKMLRYRDSSQRQFDRLRKELSALRETNPIESQPVIQQAVAAPASIIATPPPSPRPVTQVPRSASNGGTFPPQLVRQNEG